MRKRTGKKTAVLLAAVLAFQAGFSTSAAQAGSPIGYAPNILYAQDALGEVGRAGSTGQVDVTVTTALVLQKQVDFTVSLGSQMTRTLTLRPDSLETGRVSFEGVAPGDYALTVTAPGFASFTQTVTVGQQGCAINLTTGFLGGVNYTQAKAHPGVLLIGDVDGDGTVGDNDRFVLVDAIDGKRTATSVMDLNGDGVVDLVDLEYFTKSYQENRDTSASPETFVPASVIDVVKDADTNIVSGNIGDVLSGEGAVVLAPKNGGEISSTNPVSLEFDLGSGSDVAVQTDGILINTAGDNLIQSATIKVIDESGNEIKIPVEAGIHFLLKREGVVTERDNAGNIRINLGTQIAVKKVTLIITGMQKSNDLAKISKVEFVNGMDKRIPPPEMDIPERLAAQAGSEQVSLSWSPAKNITGYEVMVKLGDVEETVFTTVNSIDITTFGGKGLKNYTEYTFSVQSVNGTWRSGYCESVKATPKPTKKPDKPDNVKAVGNYQSISVSWKQMKDTVTYNLYYKESTAGSYQKITGLENNSYTIQNLKDLTQYMVYVTGVNEFGESGPSLVASAKTIDLQAPAVPRYHLINMGGAGEKGAHIVSALRRAACTMTASPLDTDTTSAWGTVDNNPLSYYQTAGWDEGGFNYMGQGVGLTYEFDQAYKMDTIGLYCYAGYDYTYAHVRYWGEDGVAHDIAVSRQNRQDAEGRPYSLLKLAQPVMAKKIQIGLGCSVAGDWNIRVAEVYFYHYDELMEEIMSLYQDDLHMVLRPDVTQSTINALRFKINQIDEISGEYNPDLEVLERELKTAEDILNDVALNAPLKIHSDITTNDVGRGFGGINAWQPLGITAGAGDKITIYVGHSTKKTGDATNLSVVASQYHSEANAIASGAGNLKVGANVIVIPRIGTLAEQENGGSIYIQYSGDPAKDPGEYAVRVSGGVSVPKLDLYQVTENSERLARVTTYIRELENFVGKLEEYHNKLHKTSENSMLNAYAYDKENCILGASDILLDTMMLSLPAEQLLAGAAGSTVQERAVKMLASLDAMDDMMYLFYQHKGLNANAADEVDKIPKGHLNIRYQRMFAGAFMYAAGNHIGIEYGSAAGLTSCTPPETDANGKWIGGGQYFGWGIAHEIGHDINQGAYAVAEITNNYFAVLAQAKDNNDSVRFKYPNVYEKVTSNTLGKASNVFTQLAMYWQLHLAYDKGYNYKTYADYKEQLANLFFARVDTYARTPAKAPAPNKVALTISGGSDQALMRLACAAAEKNLLEFFKRWGMVPDADTIAYASQFAEEERAIYYANDEARVYALNGAGTKMGEAGSYNAVSDATTSTIRNQNQVDFTLAAQGIPAEDILGFEITRCMISGGETQKQTVGFATTADNASTADFTDTIATINNRMVWYEVAVIDKYLNRSAAKTLEPLKIQHDGSLDKSFFTVSTTGLTVEGETEDMSGTTSGDAIVDTEDGAEGNDAVPKSKDLLIDNNNNTVYTANASANAEIVLEFNTTAEVAGFKYTAPAGQSPVGSYVISLLCDGVWKDVASGAFGAEQPQTIHFANADNKYVATYEATALKLKLEGMGSTVSIAELDVLGVTGDNVDFRRADGVAAIGKLTADFKYAEDNEDGTKNIIPADSVIFTGSYKGNAAYNTVILYDQKGDMVVVNGKSNQIILADVPDTGNIANTKDGTWIYWLEPNEANEAYLKTLKKVRVELYRVNNALTNEGQRLVSDSLFEAVPETLPAITLDGGITTQDVEEDAEETPSEDENTPTGTPSEDENTPTGTPSEDENTPTGTPSEDENTPTGTPSEDENTPTGTPSEDENTPTETPSEDENTPTGTPSEDENTPTGTPSEDENTPTGTPSEDENAPTDTPSIDENAPTDTPSDDVNDPTQTPSEDGNVPTEDENLPENSGDVNGTEGSTENNANNPQEPSEPTDTSQSNPQE